MSPASSAAHAPSHTHSSASRIAGHVRRLAHMLELALEVRRERRMLATLDDRGLSDVGFDRGRAHAEAQRSFWDLPANRLCM